MAPALLFVMKPNPEKLYPEHFLKAGGELLAIMFFLTFVITLITGPETCTTTNGTAVCVSYLDDNPIKDMVGYNNRSVFFHTAPAVYVAQAFFVMCAYFTIRYAWTDYERTKLLEAAAADESNTDARPITPGQVTFSLTMDVVFVVSTNIFGLVFVLPPTKSIVGHTLAFLQFVVVRFLVVLANFVEHPGPTQANWIFLYFYAFTTSGFFLTVFIDMLAGEAVIPWVVTALFDVLWVISLILTSRFLPNAEVMINVHDIGEREALLAGGDVESGSAFTVGDSIKVLSAGADGYWRKCEVIGVDPDGGTVKVRFDGSGNADGEGAEEEELPLDSDRLQGGKKSPEASPRAGGATPRDEWTERVWEVFDSIDKMSPDSISWDEFFLFWQNTGLKTGKPSLQITEAKENKGHAEFHNVDAADGNDEGFLTRDQLADLIRLLKLDALVPSLAELRSPTPRDDEE